MDRIFCSDQLLCVPCQGVSFLRVKYPTGLTVVPAGSTQGDSGGDKWVEALWEKASLGGQ